MEYLTDLTYLFQQYNPTFLVTQSNNLLDQYHNNQQSVPIVQLFKPESHHYREEVGTRFDRTKPFELIKYYLDRIFTMLPVPDRSTRRN